MPNIVYVLTNPAMPGVVKIGMTERDDVQRRMTELYSTGVPLPFDCVIARQLEDVEAARVENALHTAFDPSRINPSREFFQIDPEQVEALLQVMPGQDVTPRVTEQITALQPEDSKVASEYKRRQAKTNEDKFMESLNDNRRIIYKRVLDLGKQEGMRISWGKVGFSVGAFSNGSWVVICYGYPPSSGYQIQFYTDFPMIERKTSIPRMDVERLRESAMDTGLFVPVGKGLDISCRTDQNLEESQLDALIGWLESVIAKIRMYENVDSDEDSSAGADSQ